MAYQGKQIQYGANAQNNTQKAARKTAKNGSGGGNRPPKPPQAPKRRVRWGRLLLMLVLFLLVMGLTGLAGYGWFLERKMVEPADANAQPLAKDGPVYVLIAGLDRDPGGDAARQMVMNTDVLIVARLDPAAKKASLLSIPRDTRVELPTGMNKINSAYAVGGMDRLKRTVEDLTTVKVDRFLMIDFPGFVRAVDAIGGVNFTVDKAISNPEGTVHLVPGPQHLSGEEALAVVRFRNEAMGDISRVQRQQRLLEALLGQLKETSVVDWMKSMRAMSDGLRTDLSISEMGTLATAMQGEAAAFETHTVPGEFLDLYGTSYWKPDEAGLRKLVQSSLTN